MLESTKNKEADEVAQRTFYNLLRLDTKSMSKDLSDSAVNDICKKHSGVNNTSTCSRSDLEESDTTFEPDGEYKTILAQYDGDRASYVAIHDNDDEQITDTQDFPLIDNSDFTLVKFVVDKKNGEYKVTRMYEWFETSKVQKKFLNKENVYELKGKYSDLYKE
ncbi:hypothetical protein JGZ52_00445 [Staphylococcus pseudintermedius]|uniref:hypothetical protein n=1 Tax=Staphylococcus pseudintermedius TaxID=283734 RepID=UPI0018F6E46A|nr:hypothetical protein [Staphylococcus pseudintermedius]MBJ8322725.1 hypothetical protein [Staphylococcus pseudintermedius]